MTTARELYFSATIITLDGTNTNAHGEGCEPGKGYTEQSGWWNPDRSYWRVHAERDDVTADVYPDGEDRGPARWLADRLVARLGAVDSYDDGRTFYGAFEAVHPGRLTDLVTHPASQSPGVGHALAFIRRGVARKGQRFLTAAGHAHGFTDTEMTEAAQLLDLGPDGTTRT
jgi:ribosomal protein S18 acetylase RimI-like enzyme